MRRGHGKRGRGLLWASLAGVIAAQPAAGDGIAYKVFVNDDGVECVLSVHLPAGAKAPAGAGPDEATKLDAAMNAIRAGYADTCDPASKILVTIVTMSTLDAYGQAQWNRVKTYGEYAISAADAARLRQAEEPWSIEQSRAAFTPTKGAP